MMNNSTKIHCKDCIHSRPSHISDDLLHCIKRRQLRVECGFCKVYNRTTCTPEYDRYSISSIGKTVFLSKEEAKQALKEEQNHD